ncbi:MAG: RraA family protein [SAR324 cluster bacterium]|nr:RraA family protein [SAR324 cluster bacterium]
MDNSNVKRLSHSEILELKRWNTPTIYNGWEMITRHDRTKDGINLEETTDFMPQMGPMVGYAVTVTYRASDREYQKNHPENTRQYRAYVASVPGPKIVVVQDLDKPKLVGSLWGEVNSNTHRSLGCVGTITDGGIRDLEEMTNAGFKALARRMCVGHGYGIPVSWNCEVEVFGQTIRPGQLIHADKHGFLALPDEDLPRILDASRFMDSNECQTVIAAARDTVGMSKEDILHNLEQAKKAFSQAAKEKFESPSES